jgi:6-phosphogluconolactonase
MALAIEIVQPNLYAGAVADEIIESANEFIGAQGFFSIALSGGTTPGAVYRSLSNSSRSSRVEWEKIKLFIGDERWVSLEDSMSNYHMVCETLVDAVNFPKDRFFHVDTSVSDPAKAAENYSATLLKELPNENGTPIVDLVLLGLGEDGHIASLFPGSNEVLEEREKLVVCTKNPEDSSLRVSLAPRVILNARRVLFLVRGESKAKILKSVVNGTQDVQQLPAMMVVNEAKMVTWYVDSAAATNLPPEYRG